MACEYRKDCDEECFWMETCPRCQGTGREAEHVTMGLGPHGLVPAYVENPCRICGGRGEIVVWCEYYDE